MGPWTCADRSAAWAGVACGGAGGGPYPLGIVTEDQLDVGVGPWIGDRPDDPRYDPELLAAGDRRNVVDRYRYWRREAIVADLDARRHDFHVAIENWQHDFNIGTVVRNANAFLAAEVHIVGRRRWNRRGAMVTDRYQHVRHHPTIEEFVGWAAGREPAGGRHRQPARLPAAGDRHPAPALRAALRPGGARPVRRRPGPPATSSSRSPSTARPARSTPGVASGIAMHAWIRAHATARRCDPPPPRTLKLASRGDASVRGRALARYRLTAGSAGPAPGATVGMWVSR